MLYNKIFSRILIRGHVLDSKKLKKMTQIMVIKLESVIPEKVAGLMSVS